MGFNTSVILFNDDFGTIEKDREFGEKLVKATMETNKPKFHQTFIHGAEVIETHHADQTSIVAFGGNCGHILSRPTVFGWKHDEVELLKALANQYGYTLRKKPEKKA